MLVTSSRAPMMGPLASPSATSPDSHRHHLSHLDDEHHPADLSPRSSNSSVLSSNESLLNTSTSVASPMALPSAVDQSAQRRMSGGSSNEEEVEGRDGRPRVEGSVSPVHKDANALQNLRKAFEQASYPGYLSSGDHLSSASSDNQMEHKAYLGGYGSMLNSPTNLSTKSAGDSEDEVLRAAMGRTSPRTQVPVSGIAAVIFQCPLCAVICNSRHDFNEHLVTHSTEHRACPKCTFAAANEEELRIHVQENHGTDDLELLSDDEEVKTPKTNAQGKLKTFKCKQCEYTAVTKKEFWDHNKTHIRAEKMLHCPKCPFVTEYKHHLEYHLRNHTGSKPYQCNKCSYSCVNKSMLNSHLKSHSNIYQYRCADCSYATKYCHSLKLHLRKYSHNPAMVLNPDGTPNPLPIIDVYGTRRGPKIKRPDPILEGLASTQPLAVMPSTSPTKTPRKQRSAPGKKDKTDRPHLKHQQHILDARDLSPKPASSPRYISSMPTSATPPLRSMKEDHSSGDSDSEMRGVPGAHYPGKVGQLPQAPISPSSIALILQRNNANNGEHRKDSTFPHQPASPNPLDIYQSLNQYLFNPMLHMTNGVSIQEILAAQQLANEQKTKLLAHLLQTGMIPTTQAQPAPTVPVNEPRSTPTSLSFGSNGMALDLSGGNAAVFGGSDEKQKRKRKGKAHRYERRSSEDDEEEMMEDEALDFSANNNNNAEFKDKNCKRGYLERERPTDLSLPSPPLQPLMCKYCEISFPIRELYTIHMNYHSGDMDPFLCKSCGKKSRDNVEFFKHIVSDPH